MNNQKFQTMLENVLLGNMDHAFDNLVKTIHCMSSPRVYGVLNACVSAMEADELYVEVGTYQGGSLIAALLNNTAQAIGVDNFSEFNTTNNFDRTLNNLVTFGIASRASLKNMSYQEFFKDLPDNFKIQVYYYDGAHDYQNQLNGCEAAWPYLQKGSLILVDDYFYPDVHRALNQFIANHIDQIRCVFILHPVKDLDPLWWNGVVVLQVI